MGYDILLLNRWMLQLNKEKKMLESDKSLCSITIDTVRMNHSNCRTLLLLLRICKILVWIDHWTIFNIPSHNVKQKRKTFNSRPVIVPWRHIVVKIINTKIVLILTKRTQGNCVKWFDLLGLECHRLLKLKIFDSTWFPFLKRTHKIFTVKIPTWQYKNYIYSKCIQILYYRNMCEVDSIYVHCRGLFCTFTKWRLEETKMYFEKSRSAKNFVLLSSVNTS